MDHGWLKLNLPFLKFMLPLAMKNSEMLIVNAALIIAALIINFVNKGFTAKKWKYQLLTVLFVSPLFWILAVLFVKLELLIYNDGGNRAAAVFGVPLNVYFYLTAIIFLSISVLEIIKKLVVEKITLLPRLFFLFPAAVFIVSAIIFYSRTYTFIILLSGAMFFLFTGAVKHRLIQSGRFITGLTVNLVLFSILEILRAQWTAGAPIKNEIWNIFLLNTAIENFIYVFAIAGISLAVYSVLSWNLQYERKS